MKHALTVEHNFMTMNDDVPEKSIALESTEAVFSYTLKTYVYIRTAIANAIKSMVFNIFSAKDLESYAES